MSRLLILLVLFSLGFSPLSFANSYSRGNYDCEDFEKATYLYETYPEEIPTRTGYAMCLLIKGELEQRKENVMEGLAILKALVQDHNNVKAAWVIANYTRTGGTFEKRDPTKYQEAINAYLDVWHLIDIKPDYPDIFEIDYELESQIEIRTIDYIVSLYFSKFKKGVIGSHNMHLMRSPNYKGRRNLNTYPDYSPHTRDSLKQMVHFAKQCLDLPSNKAHFKPNYYRAYQQACRISKDAVTGIEAEGVVGFWELETERRALLLDESCSSDLPNCDEYNEIYEQIKSTAKQVRAELKVAFSPLFASD